MANACQLKSEGGLNSHRTQYGHINFTGGGTGFYGTQNARITILFRFYFRGVLRPGYGCGSEPGRALSHREGGGYEVMNDKARAGGRNGVGVAGEGRGGEFTDAVEGAPFPHLGHDARRGGCRGQFRHEVGR